jgi:hypothetical protein
MALSRQGRPAAAASFAFPKLLAGRLNPRLFDALQLFIS